MRENLYRTISHWIEFEDFDYPSTYIENKIQKKALAAKNAGVNGVIIYGMHLRWDFIVCFETVTALIKYIVEAYHQYGITVIDHHSAVCTHRPPDMAGRWDTYKRNHHHLVINLDKTIIDQLHYAGTPINSWRQKRVDNNEPVFIPAYQVEMYCINNPSFQKAYLAYLTNLVGETELDGVESDDIVHYGQWRGCGCEHCRAKFKNLYGHALPDTADMTFWGNYDNPAWRDWLTMRYADPKDFLQLIRNALGPKALMTSCCCASTGKFLDTCSMSMVYMNEPLNLTMLEMCGEIFGGHSKITDRIPDMLLHRGISERRNIGCLGLAYAFFPDTAFLGWSLNRFFGSDNWISTQKGRLGILEDIWRTLPDDPEIVHEAFNFEQRHPQLFIGVTASPVAVYYSQTSKMFNGDSVDDYQNSFYNLVRAMFEKNYPLAVVDKVPEVKRHPILVLADCDCVADDFIKDLTKYIEDGGKVIASGLLGNRDERGNFRKDKFLAQYGVEQILPQVDRSCQNKDNFFEFGAWHPQREIPGQVEYRGKLNTDKLYWTDKRLHKTENVEPVLRELDKIIRLPLELEVPADIKYQVYQADNRHIIHFLPAGMTPVYHPTIRNQYAGDRLVEKVNYPLLSGRIAVKGNFVSAKLYSADLAETKTLPVTNGEINFELKDIKRFFTIEVINGQATR